MTYSQYSSSNGTV